MSEIYDILEKKIGDKIGEYRSKWSRAGKQDYVPEYPLHLNFELNFGCNLKCDFCLHSIPLKDWNYQPDPSQKISLGKYKEIMDQGAENNLYSVEFNGINEPLLKKDICDYIKYIHEKNIPLSSLHTNALSLTEKMSSDLIDSGLKLIIFSVDALKPETYNDLRINSDYDIVSKNINNFLDIRKERCSTFPLVQMSFSKNKLNYMELPEYIEHWQDKVDFVSVSSFSNAFIGGEKEMYAENKYRFESYDIGECFEPYQRLLIRNDGKVHLCCSFFGGENVVGDIYEDSVMDIWNGEKLRKERTLVNSKEGGSQTCKKCRQSMKVMEKNSDRFA